MYARTRDPARGGTAPPMLAGKCAIASPDRLTALMRRRGKTAKPARKLEEWIGSACPGHAKFQAQEQAGDWNGTNPGNIGLRVGIELQFNRYDRIVSLVILRNLIDRRL